MKRVSKKNKYSRVPIIRVNADHDQLEKLKNTIKAKSMKKEKKKSRYEYNTFTKQILNLY